MIIPKHLIQPSPNLKPEGLDTEEKVQFKDNILSTEELVWRFLNNKGDNIEVDGQKYELDLGKFVNLLQSK